MTPPFPIVELTRRYCEPHRSYHGIQHIGEMLWNGREHALTDEQIAAIWYHDAIYDPTQDDNEERSAELAASDLRAAGWPTDRIQLVERIVLDTKQHVPSCGPAAIVLDLDLWSLAIPADAFDRNTARIRAEYAHVGDREFAEGRQRYFAALLERERIFWTPWGAAFEPAARANLRRGLGAFDRGPRSTAGS